MRGRFCIWTGTLLSLRDPLDDHYDSILPGQSYPPAHSTFAPELLSWIWRMPLFLHRVISLIQATLGANYQDAFSRTGHYIRPVYLFACVIHSEIEGDSDLFLRAHVLFFASHSSNSFERRVPFQRGNSCTGHYVRQRFPFCEPKTLQATSLSRIRCTPFPCVQQSAMNLLASIRSKDFSQISFRRS